MIMYDMKGKFLIIIYQGWEVGELFSVSGEAVGYRSTVKDENKYSGDGLYC